MMDFTDDRLSAYRATTPDASPDFCPTWVFEAAARAAFAGTGELEDGTIVIEDIISVLSSLIDQVGWVGVCIALTTGTCQGSVAVLATDIVDVKVWGVPEAVGGVTAGCACYHLIAGY